MALPGPELVLEEYRLMVFSCPSPSAEQCPPLRSYRSMLIDRPSIP